ncbi:MAG: B12-binding domain-containing radical SAM protein [Coriobacteriales bacterium]|jgi:radical SAM superfamily enzyme YgiQ (UPF0313 family)
MRVTFINPAPLFRRLGIYRWGADVYGHPDSITGPLILAGIVSRAGHEVEVYEELNGKFDMDRLIERTDVLCLYTMTSSAKRAYQLADMFHEKGHARVIIGGMHASALPEEALEHADQVLVGEGENIILDAVEGRLTDPIVRADPICDLDTVPFPDYSLLKTPCEAADILTSRGCPFRCTFCTTSRMFAPYRKRSVDNVIEEVRLYKEMGFEYMNFEDDNFTADKERAKEICRRMIDEGLVFKQTFFFGRTDMADDPELLDLLAEAHLTRVLIGIESLNQDSLDIINKHQTVDDIERAGIACKEHGIEVIASIVLGLDGDYMSDIENSIDFARRIDAYQLQPAVLTPFPGTPVYEQYQRENRMIMNDVNEWSCFDMMNATYQPRHLSPWELQMEFCDMARRFYTRRSAVRMGFLFGAEYGWRRYGLALSAFYGTFATWAAGTFAYGTTYYKVKHTDWMFKDDPDNIADRKRRAEEHSLPGIIKKSGEKFAEFVKPENFWKRVERVGDDISIAARRKLNEKKLSEKPDPFADVPKRPMPSEKAIIPLKIFVAAQVALPVVLLAVFLNKNSKAGSQG